jgi:hypothetical protein
VLGGSASNEIGANVVGATIAGGGEDAITGTDTPNRVLGNFGTIGGGTNNTVNGATAFIGGGANNTATGSLSVVTGGSGNTTTGVHSMVPGGFDNEATGQFSLAAGAHAKANHNGAFVWADTTSTDFVSTANNQFNVRAVGGVRIFTKSDLSIGVSLNANDSSWNIVSDRNAKTNIVPVDTVDILERLAGIPMATWNYKGVENPIRHIGPMAQDFFAAFKVGMDDKHIGSVDADGVALAAIQGLYRKLKTVEEENAALKARLDAVEAVLAELKARH